MDIFSQKTANTVNLYEQSRLTFSAFALILNNICEHRKNHGKYKKNYNYTCHYLSFLSVHIYSFRNDSARYGPESLSFKF